MGTGYFTTRRFCGCETSRWTTFSFGSESEMVDKPLGSVEALIFFPLGRKTVTTAPAIGLLSFSVLPVSFVVARKSTDNFFWLGSACLAGKTL
jgi:hypothetical protein